MTQPLFILHRGNSLEQLSKIKNEKLNGVEMDLRMTADGAVVVHHDRTFLNGDGRRYWIDRINFADISQNGHEKIITFEEAVKQVVFCRKSGELIFDLDLKQLGMEKEIGRVLRMYGIKNIVASSTDLWILKKFEEKFPHAKISLSYYPNERWDLARVDFFRFLALLSYFSLKPFLFRLIRRKTADKEIHIAVLDSRLVNKKVVQFLHDYNIEVFVCGADSKKEIARLLKLNVDAVKTRRPELLKYETHC